MPSFVHEDNIKGPINDLVVKMTIFRMFIKSGHDIYHFEAGSSEIILRPKLTQIINHTGR